MESGPFDRYFVNKTLEKRFRRRNWKFFSPRHYWNNTVNRKFNSKRLAKSGHVFRFLKKGTASLFRWSSHMRCSRKRLFLKFLQNSQKKTCVRVSFLKNLHEFITFFKKGYSTTSVFLWTQRNFKYIFFQNPSEQLLLNFSNKN